MLAAMLPLCACGRPAEYRVDIEAVGPEEDGENHWTDWYCREHFAKRVPVPGWSDTWHERVTNLSGDGERLTELRG